MNVPLMHSIRPSNIDGLIAMELADAAFHTNCASLAWDSARRVRSGRQVNPWFDAAVEHATQAAHHHATAIGWSSR